METQTPATSVPQSRPQNPPASVRATGYFAGAQPYLSPDGEFVVHRIPGGGRVQKHANLYRHVLGISYEPRTSTPRPMPQVPPAGTKPILGFVGDARVVLSRDSQYLIHYLPEGRITHPVQLYRQLLAGLEAGAEPEAKSAASAPDADATRTTKARAATFGDA